MIDKDIFGKRICELRNKYGLSQYKLAQMLNVTYQAVSKWENGLGLPDIELIPLLAQVFGVSTDYLLCKSNDIGQANIYESLQTFEHWGEKSSILSILSNTLLKQDFYALLKMMENDEIDFRVNIEAISKINSKSEICSKTLSLEGFNIEALNCISAEITQLVSGILNKRNNVIKTIINKMICPECKGTLQLNELEGNSWLECENAHKFMVIDGVVDFDTYDELGNEWSKAFRSYTYFKKKIEQLYQECKERDCRRETIIRNLTKKVKEVKPGCIVEIASGMGSFIQNISKEIDWPCTIILTDISHRILRYLRRYMEETMFNPMIKIVYLACDARSLPIQDSTVDCVVSYSGYENIMENDILAVQESYRVLKAGGECIYSMMIVDDLNSELVNGWVRLLEKTQDPVALVMLEKVRSKDDWYRINQEVGFRDIEINKLINEYAAHDLSEFPYENEILRWMGEAIITSVK